MSASTATVYGDFDQAGLDAAYDNRAAVRSSARYFAEWQARSEALRRSRPAERDLRYGAERRACLDFFPAENANAATLVFIHGGYWQWNSKDDFSFIAEGPLARGMNVALVGYTLAPEASLGRIVDEVRAALRWLPDFLAKGGRRADRLCVSGWSAGGHLAALTADEASVAAVAAISGIYDLAPIRLSYLNRNLGLTEDQVLTHSPIFHPVGDRPVLLAVGGDEMPELRRQTTAYHHALLERGRASNLAVVSGCHHYSVLEELARPTGAIIERVLAMMEAG